MESPLALHGVSYSYRDVVALTDITLTVDRGEILALMGRNGAGKTTLLSIAAGLRRPARGRVVVQGTELASEPPPSTGWAGQSTALYPTLSVAENLHIFGALAGLRPSVLGARVEELTSALSLGDVAHRRVRHLSGGQRRRVHVATAMIARPGLLLLDEPTSGVDEDSRDRVVAAVSEAAAQGSAVCMSTHHVNEVERLDASVAVLHRGELVAHGTPAALIAESGRATVVEVVTEEPNATSGCPPTTCRVATMDPAETSAQLVAHALEREAALVSLEVQRPTMSGLYRSLTETPTAPAPAPIAAAVPDA